MLDETAPTNPADWTFKDVGEARAILGSLRGKSLMRLLQAFLQRYASAEARALLPWLKGPRLLDLGAGEGWVAEALRRRAPVWVCAVDVGPFGLAADPYVVYDGARLPFGDGAFDTTLLSFVLHHTETPGVVLDEAVRVSRERLLVVESVYRDRLERFWLDLLDGRVNRYRHGGRMNVPLAFRRPEQWRALFESRGLRVVATEWLGSRLERLVHHPVLFVVNRPCLRECSGHGVQKTFSDGSGQVFEISSP